MWRQNHIQDFWTAGYDNLSSFYDRSRTGCLFQFKKEDIKTVQKKEQKKSDTPLTQYSKNAFVNSVRVNGTVNVSLKVHGNEKLLFVHTLTRDADPSTPVKWDITHNGKEISVGLLEPPLRSFFTEEGRV